MDTLKQDMALMAKDISCLQVQMRQFKENIVKSYGPLDSEDEGSDLKCSVKELQTKMDSILASLPTLNNVSTTKT